MSFWAQGFEPRTDRAAAQCGPGTKNCGKICIAQNAECHIGKGKVGLAQTLGGAALFGAGVAAASQGHDKAALGLAAAGLGLYTRGQYNIGRSAGHSTVGGAIGKYAVGVQPTPLGLGAAALGTLNAQKSLRPAVNYPVGPVGQAFTPDPKKTYSVMSPEEYEAHKRSAGANAKKPIAANEWGQHIFEEPNQAGYTPRVSPSSEASAERYRNMQEMLENLKNDPFEGFQRFTPNPRTKRRAERLLYKSNLETRKLQKRMGFGTEPVQGPKLPTARRAQELLNRVREQNQRMGIEPEHGPKLPPLRRARELRNQMREQTRQLRKQHQRELEREINKLANISNVRSFKDIPQDPAGFRRALLNKNEVWEL